MNKEEIITLKKENDYDDLDHVTKFLENMSISDLIQEVVDSGLAETSKNRGINIDNLRLFYFKINKIIKHLEDDAYTVIKAFWDQLKVTKEEVSKESSNEYFRPEGYDVVP